MLLGTIEFRLPQDQLIELARLINAGSKPSEVKETYSVPELAEKLGIHRSTVLRRISAGIIRTIPNMGRTLVSKKELQRLLGED